MSSHVYLNKNDVMRLGERPRSMEGKPNYLDLPFAINLYYSMCTISYTPRFSYLFKMTLIKCSRIVKDRDRSLGKATRAAMTASSFQHPGLSVVVRLCPNVYHTSEYVLDHL